MLKIVFPKILAATSVALCGLVLPAAVIPATAQDGLAMRSIVEKLGLLPEEKDPIEYRERPALVVPKDLTRLQPPEKPEAHTKNGQWPVDPDVQALERRRAQRNSPASIFATASSPSEGGRLSLKEMAAGRIAKGVKSGEEPTPSNDKGTIRLSIQEMQAADAKLARPTYAPGTEPARVYLTDPPSGLRIPSSAAPSGKRTTEAPVDDNDFRRPSAERIQ